MRSSRILSVLGLMVFFSATASARPGQAPESVAAYEAVDESGTSPKQRVEAAIAAALAGDVSGVADPLLVDLDSVLTDSDPLTITLVQKTDSETGEAQYFLHLRYRRTNPRGKSIYQRRNLPVERLAEAQEVAVFEGTTAVSGVSFNTFTGRRQRYVVRLIVLFDPTGALETRLETVRR